MRRREPVTHVEVSRETREKLKEKKDELGVRSVDAVIQHFLSGPQDDGEEESSSDNEGEDSGEPEKRRRIDVREPLYSLEILAERPGMLEYYTGFDRPTVDLLIRRFSEVRLERVFFLFCCYARKRAVFMVRACCSYLLLIGHRIRSS
jgi:hypothetical protein